MDQPAVLALDKTTSDKIELLKRLVICHGDLQTSLSALTFLGEADENAKYDRVELRRFKCYETAFVVSYGRAFTESKGSKYKQLSFRAIGLKLSEEERSLHEKIISSRQQKYAHSDLTRAHTRIDLYIQDVRGEDFPFSHIQWDEGLDFIGNYAPIQYMELIRNIMAHLFKTTSTLAYELKDFLPIYIKPNSDIE